MRCARSLAGFAPGDLVLAACSGGPDSLALAAALAFVAPRAGLRAGAVTVDHGLQDGSADRAAAVAAVLGGLGLDPVRRGRGDGRRRRRTGGGGADGALRRARGGGGRPRRGGGAARPHPRRSGRDRAARARARLGRAVAGGHAGRGAASSCGRCSACAARDGRDACAALGLAPWADPHNADRRFARVRVRLDALPALEAALGPGVAEALARTADQLRDDAEVLDQIASSERSASPRLMSAASLAGLPGAVRSRVLRSAALAAGCPATALTSAHVTRIERAGHGLARTALDRPAGRRPGDAPVGAGPFRIGQIINGIDNRLLDA